jgi:FkbM family methyltransferase
MNCANELSFSSQNLMCASSAFFNSAACLDPGKLYAGPVLLERAIRKIRNLRRNGGTVGMLEFAIKERYLVAADKILPGTRFHGRQYTLRTRYSPVPVTLRAGTSDRTVFNQVFVYEGYDLFEPGFDPEFIVDAGANVGFSSVFFLSRYPRAKVAAIEPDPGNYAMLLKNTAPFSARLTGFNRGLWPFTTGLKLVRGQFADGREWAFQVRPVGPDEEPDLQAVDMETVLKESGFPRIDLLKMDIERAELELFRHRPLPWLRQVRAIAIELHDSECEKVFFEAINGRAFVSKAAGETTLVTFRD